MKTHILCIVGIVIIGCICGTSGGAVQSGPQPATDLVTEYLSEPLGLAVQSVRFSYKLHHSETNQNQYAYHITVTNNDSNAIVWDSGKVVSDQTLNINYKGTILTSDTRYTWTVTWWDKNDQIAPVSQTASFTTGLYNSNDWETAQWICGATNQTYQFATTFIPKSNQSNIKRASVFLSGVGYSYLYVNGIEGDKGRVLDPGWTTYDKTLFYSSYDVTTLLKQRQGKEHSVAVELGRGWYTFEQYGQPMFKLLLRIHYNDATIETLTSASTWLGSIGPITYNDIYNGETYDARLQTPNWPDFISTAIPSSFTVVKVVSTEPKGVLVSQVFEPIRRIDVFTPRVISEPLPGVYVVDFGQNMSGWCLLRIQGNAGTTITLRHAEILQHDGSGMIYTDNLRSALATDTFILAGKDVDEIFEPRFTYHGFRYVEISGLPSGVGLTESSIRAVHIRSSVKDAGSFVTNVDVLNRVHMATRWGLATNLMSVPTDCDQRDERKGWMGDAGLTYQASLFNFGMSAFYTNFLGRIRDAMVDGQVPDTVPLTFGSQRGDPAWGTAYPSITLGVSRTADDQQVLLDNYNNVKSWIDFLTSQVKETGLANMYSNYGDWVPPPPFDRTSSQLISAFSYLHDILTTMSICQKLNNNNDYSIYNELYKEQSQAFFTAFYNKTGNGCFDDHCRQSANALALWLPNIMSLDIQHQVYENLINDIVNNNYHLTTGIVGTKFLLETLTKYGNSEMALRLAAQTTYPSWGFMIYHPLEPATTLWELWDSPSEGPGMNSRNHHMFGSVDAWLYTSLAGIESGDHGYKNIAITPPEIKDNLNNLTSLTASVNTLRGIVGVEWNYYSKNICESISEGEPLRLHCSGPNSVISKLNFVSYGTPTIDCVTRTGTKGSCDASKAMDLISSMCLNHTNCTINVTNEFFQGDPCVGTLKKLGVIGECSTDGYDVKVSIPVGSTAQVIVPHTNTHYQHVMLNNVTVCDKKQLMSSESVTITEDGHVVVSVGSGVHLISANQRM